MQCVLKNLRKLDQSGGLKKKWCVLDWTDCGYRSDGAMNANWTFPVQVVVSMYAGGQESGPTVSASAVKAYPS